MAVATIRQPRPVLNVSVRRRAIAITHEHALRVASLPAHHRDPFDRLLIAQAQLDGLVIMTSDAHFSAYEVEVIGP